MKKIKNIFKFREASILLVVILLLIVLIAFKPIFLTKINLFGMLNYIAENFIMIGMLTVILVLGCIDLSVGSFVGFSGILVGILMVKAQLPVPLAIILTLLVAAAIGAFNGYVIAYIGINPFVTTLITWLTLVSLKFIIGHGVHIYKLPESFQKISQTRFLHIPLMVYIALFSVIVFSYLLKKNIFFRQSYYIGGNENAAKLLGIKVKAVKLVVYVIMGMVAALAGILTASRMGVAYTTAGNDAAFILVAGAIIGGSSLHGGKGSVIGSVLGLAFMAIVYDAIVLFSLNIYWNYSILGLIILGAISLDGVIATRKKLMLG